MAGARDREQLGRRRDELERRCHLLDGAEAVARAVNEQRRYLEAGEMRCARRSGLQGRMKRVRKQQQAMDKLRFVRGEH